MEASGDHDYRILVRGLVGPRFAQVFDSIRIQQQQGHSAIVGPVRDQAELQGMVDLLSGLGFEILCVRQLSRRGG